MTKRYYLSGPMTGLPDFNAPAFNKAAEQLRALGLDVVNPAEINQDASDDWHQCIRNDIKALCDCTHIVLLDGWEGSNGAHLELHLAHRMGLEVMQVRDLLEEQRDEDHERRLFEAWASDRGTWPEAIERSGEGYKLLSTHELWRAWKERASH